MSKSRTDAVTATTISAKDAAYTELTSGSYELSSGGSGTIQARILCQPAGSSVYYQADILVLSDAADVTAAEVVSWLRARGRSARWVHSEDPVVGLRLELSEGGSRSQLVFERAQGLDLGEIGAVWHRQSAFHFRLPPGLSPGLAALLTADIASAREGCARCPPSGCCLPRVSASSASSGSRASSACPCPRPS